MGCGKTLIVLTKLAHILPPLYGTRNDEERNCLNCILRRFAVAAGLCDLRWHCLLLGVSLGMNINIAMALTTKANYDKNCRLAGYSNMPVEKVNWERTKTLVKVSEQTVKFF